MHVQSQHSYAIQCHDTVAVHGISAVYNIVYTRLLGDCMHACMHRGQDRLRVYNDNNYGISTYKMQYNVVRVTLTAHAN